MKKIYESKDGRDHIGKEREHEASCSGKDRKVGNEEKGARRDKVKRFESSDGRGEILKNGREKELNRDKEKKLDDSNDRKVIRKDNADMGRQFRAGELRGEILKEGNRRKECFREEEMKHGDGGLQVRKVRRSRELRSNQANGNKLDLQGQDARAKIRGGRHSRFGRSSGSRTQSQHERVLKLNYKGHFSFHKHRQRPTGNGSAYRADKRQRRIDEIVHRDAHRPARGVVIDINFVGHRKRHEGDKKQRYVKKSRGVDEKPVGLSQNPGDQESYNTDVVVTKKDAVPSIRKIKETDRSGITDLVSDLYECSTMRCSSKIVAHSRESEDHEGKVVEPCKDRRDVSRRKALRIDRQNQNEIKNGKPRESLNGVGSVIVTGHKIVEGARGTDKLSKSTPRDIESTDPLPSDREHAEEKNKLKMCDGVEKQRAENLRSRKRPRTRELKSGFGGKDKNDLKREIAVKQKSFESKRDGHHINSKTEDGVARKLVEVPQAKRGKVSQDAYKSLIDSTLRRQSSKGDKPRDDVSPGLLRHEQGRHASPITHIRHLSPKDHSKSMSPRRFENDRAEWEKFERERISTLAAFDSRYRRFGGGTSGLGGYSPRRRRSEAAIKTPSPPPRSPERRKPRAWDLPPVGMDSTMVAVISAHQAAVQQAVVTLAAVAPLVPPSVLVSPVVPPSPVSSGLGTIPSMIPNLLHQVTPAVTAVSLTQATRPLRRLYVGNVPSTVSDGELLEFMNAAMLSANANHLQGTKPCINCSVNLEKSYAFAEFITPEDATAALAFDGVTLHGTILKIRRPKDFVLPAKGGTEGGSPVLDMVSSRVADSPRKVFVGGISSWLTIDKVKEIVTAFGQLRAYHWEVDYKKNPPQAFAFLEYLDPTVTLKACAGLNGMRLGTDFLTVVQATPDADLEASFISPPFYGIPEHAKALLDAPTRVLELYNLVSEDEVRKMSQEETDELVGDVHLECTRFGNVKSTHIVQPWVYPKLESPSVVIANENCSLRYEQSMDMDISGEVEDENCQVEGGAPDEIQNNPLGKPVAGTTISGARDGGLLIGADCGLSEYDYEGFEEQDCNQKTSPTRTGKLEIVIEEEQQPNLSSKYLSTVPSNCQDVEIIHEQDVDLNSGFACNFTKGEINVATREWEILHAGRVYVEFSREESACQAAHALHGRMFAGQKVSAGYFPLKLYQKKFGKGLGPQTFEERQALALAVQGHLTEHIKD